MLWHIGFEVPKIGSVLCLQFTRHQAIHDEQECVDENVVQLKNKDLLEVCVVLHALEEALKNSIKKLMLVTEKYMVHLVEAKVSKSIYH